MASSDQVVVIINGNAKPLQDAVAQAQAAMKQLQGTGEDSSGMFSTLTGAAGNFMSTLGGVVGQMTSFISNALQIATGVGLYNFFDTVIQKATEFGQQMFDLNNTMERYQTSWEYLFGTGNNPQSAALAQSMSDWTQKASYNYPFTRQDMLSAINAAGMATSDPNLIENNMSAIADLASTRTNAAGQPVTLQQAMMALVMANNGMSRMLKYDLKIDPTQLQQYGWTDSGDFANLLQSIQGYNAAHHLTGASQHIATSTFYGELSSLEDRIQNFQLMAGQGLFAGIKGDMNDFTSWWDGHQGELNQFATVIGTDVAGAIHALWQDAQQFAEGWQGGTGTAFEALGNLAHTGISDLAGAFQALAAGFSAAQGGTGIASGIEAIAKAAGNPAVGQFLSDLGHLAGMAAGTALNLLGQIPQGLEALGQNAGVQDVLHAFMTLQQVTGEIQGSAIMGILTGLKQGLDNFGSSTVGQAALTLLGASLQNLQGALGNLQAAWQNMVAAIPPQELQLIEHFFELLAGAVILAPIANLIVLLNGLALAENLAAGAVTYLSDGVQGIGGFFNALGTDIHNAQSPLDTITGMFNSLKQTLTGWATDLATNFHNWAGDMLQNFLDGLTAKWNDVKQWFTNAAQDIKNIFGHSVPVTGPLTDELNWMPHMMQNLAAGMITGIPLVAAASQQVAAAMAAGLQINVAGGGGGSTTNYGATSGTVNVYAPTPAMVQNAMDLALAQQNSGQHRLQMQPGSLRVGLL